MRPLGAVLIASIACVTGSVAFAASPSLSQLPEMTILDLNPEMMWVVDVHPQRIEDGIVVVRSLSILGPEAASGDVNAPAIGQSIEQVDCARSRWRSSKLDLYTTNGVATGRSGDGQDWQSVRPGTKAMRIVNAACGRPAGLKALPPMALSDLVSAYLKWRAAQAH